MQGIWYMRLEPNPSNILHNTFINTYLNVRIWEQSQFICKLCNFKHILPSTICKRNDKVHKNTFHHFYNTLLDNQFHNYLFHLHPYNQGYKIDINPLEDQGVVDIGFYKHILPYLLTCKKIQYK